MKAKSLNKITTSNQCPNCGAQLSADNSQRVKCDYCQSILNRPLSQKGLANIEYFLQVANVAKSEQDYNKAMEYYNRVTDIDWPNFDAWLGIADLTARLKGEFGAEIITVVKALAYCFTPSSALTQEQIETVSKAMSGVFWEACLDAWARWKQFLMSGRLRHLEVKYGQELMRRYFEFCRGVDGLIGIAVPLKAAEYRYLQLGKEMHQCTEKYIFNSSIKNIPDNQEIRYRTLAKLQEYNLKLKSFNQANSTNEKPGLFKKLIKKFGSAHLTVYEALNSKRT